MNEQQSYIDDYKCFLCGSETKRVFNLGYNYPSTFTEKPEIPEGLSPKILALRECLKCKCVRIEEYPPLDKMYRMYWYRSSLNKTMASCLKDIVYKTWSRFINRNKVEPERVMDIGCNDSTLLSFYPHSHWVFKVGYDPANNLRESASKVCDVFINNYFDDSIEYKDKFDIITSIAMFYDLENPRKFIKGIKKYLAEDGIWVVQMTDLTTMIRKEVMAIDNLCFEHLQYYTLEVFSNLLKEFDMEVFDLEYNSVNGGSIRTYISNVGKYKVEDSVSKALEEEKKILSEQTWDRLEIAFYEIIKSIRNFIIEEVKKGKKVYGLGASTKGNTFLQAVGLTKEHINCIMELSEEKYGKYTIGTNIPIVPEEAFNDKPDYVIILPWHFKDFFIEKNIDYLKSGGKFIVAMPEPKITSFDGVNIKEEKII